MQALALTVLAFWGAMTLQGCGGGGSGGGGHDTSTTTTMTTTGPGNGTNVGLKSAKPLSCASGGIAREALEKLRADYKNISGTYLNTGMFVHMLEYFQEHDPRLAADAVWSDVCAPNPHGNKTESPLCPIDRDIQKKGMSYSFLRADINQYGLWLGSGVNVGFVLNVGNEQVFNPEEIVRCGAPADFGSGGVADTEMSQTGHWWTRGCGGNYGKSGDHSSWKSTKVGKMVWSGALQVEWAKWDGAAQCFQSGREHTASGPIDCWDVTNYKTKYQSFHGGDGAAITILFNQKLWPTNNPGQMAAAKAQLGSEFVGWYDAEDAWSIYMNINNRTGTSASPNEILLGCCNPADPINLGGDASLNNPTEAPLAAAVAAESPTWPKHTTVDQKTDANGPHSVSAVYQALIYKDQSDQVIAKKIAEKVYKLFGVQIPVLQVPINQRVSANRVNDPADWKCIQSDQVGEGAESMTITV